MEIIIYLFIFGIIALVIYFFYKVFSQSYKSIKETNQNKTKSRSTDSATMKHISGLPLAQGTITDIFYNHNEFIFVKDN